MTPRALAALVLLTASSARAAGEIPARDFAVRAKTIVRIDGSDLSPGVAIIRDGRFAQVGGEEIQIPAGMPTVDATTRVLMPGFIDAHSQRGLDRTYETAADASFVRISDALNPVSVEIEDARRNGITTALVLPGDRAFLGGRGAVIHPQGISVDEMIVRQDAALKISLWPQPGTSRIGQLARLREILDGARKYRDEQAKRKPRAREENSQEDTSREALQALLADEIPAFVSCRTAEDVASAFELAAKDGFHVVPVLAPTAWRAVPLLRSNHVPVVLTPWMDSWERQPDGTLQHVDLARLLADAGIPFALSTDPYDVAAQHPWYQAALAVRQGVPRETALRAITSVPAKILGFGARKGVISAGADADFLLLSADPLALDCWVEESYIRGARVYARESDEKLKRLMSPGGEPPLLSAPGEPDEPEDEDEETPPIADKRGDSKDDETQRRWPLGPPR